MTEIGVWLISAATIVGILFRPWRLPEWVWALAGSVLLLLFGLISPTGAAAAVFEGVDVYLFLIGMMLLSEQARHEGLFEWLAHWATQHAKGSPRKLFGLVYGSGVLVTAFLSNDATAVVLTPAVYASVKRAGAKPIPYLFACAFVANAASFVLPISNPANLVVFESHLPGVLSWIRVFGLPSVVSIVATFWVLRLWFSEPLKGELGYSRGEAVPVLSGSGRFTACGLGVVVLVLMTASYRGWSLGLPTIVAASVIVIAIAIVERRWPWSVVGDVSWGVVPLVAGLFVVVEAMSRAGALAAVHGALLASAALPVWGAKLLAAFGVGLASNVFNNLPVGLLSGMALHRDEIPSSIRNAVLIGVDLGPNLSVTGSLATILWLIALRREGERTSGIAFLQVGAVAMPLALSLAVLLLGA